MGKRIGSEDSLGFGKDSLSRTDSEDLSASRTTSFKSSKSEKLNVNEENLKRMKELELVNRIIEQLEQMPSKRDELLKERTEMEAKLESQIELHKQKDAKIFELELQIQYMIDQDKALNSEMLLKNEEIAQNTYKLAQIFESTGLLIDQSVEESSKPAKSSVYIMENSKICEIKEESNQIEVIQRERNKEREDFIHWVDGKQLCGILKNKKWTLSLYLEEEQLDSLEIQGSNKHLDKFFLIKNRIYVAVYISWELYRITVEEKQLKVESFGKMSSYLNSLSEYKDCFFIGLDDFTVKQVKDGQMTEIFKMTKYVGALRVENDYLFACDCKGKTVKYNLISKKIEKAINVSNCGAFVSGDKIARTKDSVLYIHDWEGIQLKEFAYSSDYFLRLLKQTDKYCIVAYKNCLLVIDFATLKVDKHRIAFMPTRYLNYY